MYFLDTHWTTGELCNEPKIKSPGLFYVCNVLEGQGDCDKFYAKTVPKVLGEEHLKLLESEECDGFWWLNFCQFQIQKA